MSKISDPKSWFEAAAKSCFGLILPNGWLGRPYDNQHLIEEFRISNSEISFRFDKLRKIKIHKPGTVLVSKDDSDRTNLLVSEFEKVEFTWIPYGAEGKQPEVRVFDRGELVLVGYYI
jgi:hypothetical protein